MNKFNLVIGNGNIFLYPNLDEMLMSKENALMVISPDNVLDFSKLINKYLNDEKTNKSFFYGFYDEEVRFINHLMNANFYIWEVKCPYRASIEEKLKKMYEYVNIHYDFEFMNYSFEYETHLDVFETEYYTDWFYPAINLMALEVLTSEDEELLNEYRDLFFGDYGLISYFSLDGFINKVPVFSKEKSTLKKYLIKKYCSNEEYEEYLNIPDNLNCESGDFMERCEFKRKYIDRAVEIQNKAFLNMTLKFLKTYSKF